MNRKSVYTIIIVILFSPIVIFAKIKNAPQKVTITGTLESSNSFISYITIADKNYVIKQKRDKTRQVIAAMREALASYIAKDLNIAQFVEIIQAAEKIPGKKYPLAPATLHTLAPGKVVSELRGHKYYLLCLKQRDPNGKKITGKWLTKTIIDQITWHKHLALIIALDLFISNTDRNRRNLFYDEQSDSFCAIDMENIYRRNVADMACKKLREMVTVDHKKFTIQEIEALKTVRSTLQFLSKKYPPKHIIARMEKYAVLAGYDGSLKLAKKLTGHRKMIVECYNSVQELIGLLEDIIIGAL